MVCFFFLLLGLFIYFFIYFWLCWVFVSVWGLSPVAASGGHSSWWCAGLSLSRPLLLRSTSSRCAGSVVVAHGPSCSAACGIFPDQGSNPCPLHWQADSQPLRHQGSPYVLFFKWASLFVWISKAVCRLYVRHISKNISIVFIKLLNRFWSPNTNNLNFRVIFPFHSDGSILMVKYL